jgi:hypothetical protein
MVDNKLISEIVGEIGKVTEATSLSGKRKRTKRNTMPRRAR